jgi:hypothetical protein
MPKKPTRPVDPSDKLVENLIETALNLARAEDVIKASGEVLRAAYEYSVFMRDEDKG